MLSLQPLHFSKNVVYSAFAVDILALRLFFIQVEKIKTKRIFSEFSKRFAYFRNKTSLFLLLRQYEKEIFPNTRFSQFEDSPQISGDMKKHKTKISNKKLFFST